MNETYFDRKKLQKTSISDGLSYSLYKPNNTEPMVKDCAQK